MDTRAGDVQAQAAGPGPSLVEAAFASAPFGFAVLDRELRCLELNAALARIAGHPRQGLIGRPIAELLPAADEDVVQRFRLAVDRSEVAAAEFGDERIGPGSRRWQATCFPIDGEGDRATVFGVIVAPETSERRRLERELSTEREVAQKLTRALLPPELPKVESLEFEARLIPAEARYRVGGDFYEVFPAGDGLLVVIGDVAGKGPDAAATTGQVRQTLKALALHEDRPGRLLEQLNAALMAQWEVGQFCTVACARVRPLSTGRRLTVATAGHPRPLLTRQRRKAREIGATNPAIGFIGGHRFREKSIRLRSGDRVFFYTDGLVEAHAPQKGLSVEELRRALTGRQMIALGDLLDNVIAWARGPEGRDDVAVLAFERR